MYAELAVYAQRTIPRYLLERKAYKILIAPAEKTIQIQHEPS